MRIPALGHRGEGWGVAQLALAVAIVLAGVAGPRWSGSATSLRSIAGIAIGIVGWVLFVAGVVGLDSSLTPFPRPSERSTLRTGGAYRLVRHPIYGGSLFVAHTTVGCGLELPTAIPAWLRDNLHSVPNPLSGRGSLDSWGRDLEGQKKTQRWPPYHLADQRRD